MNGSIIVTVIKYYLQDKIYEDEMDGEYGTH